MPVPWEALIPFGLLTAMFGTAGTLLGGIQRAQNLGKPARWGVDNWDEAMMARDKLLTGHKRGQTSDAVAPPEFATNRPVTVTRIR
ncbi:hypothetical protein D9619_000243 [Psilocybe cf. subviscida]|uniref:NADH dehydrogenase [ubiquinone] 1 alpha subcomplex subunit 1 n=1 Tax=Psilocybe cf. subviscida TaxID=2480587 RepID=A0A8H5BE51_9AGAR|nr:hypothetical protein D9619_000243 [Psilocybe cf. subviscida]